MSDERDDFELLEAWRAGDEEAGATLLGRYGRGITRLFIGKVRSLDDAQDLAQRTFLACVQGRDRIRSGSSFRSYIFGIAHNLHREYLRKVGRGAVDESVSWAADGGPSASALIGDTQEQRILLEALRGLDLELQFVYQLHYWEHLSGSEIAEVLGIPEGTVRNRLRRGKEKLADEITRLRSGPHSLKATLTNFDLWARKLRDMLGLRGPKKPKVPPKPSKNPRDGLQN